MDFEPHKIAANPLVAGLAGAFVGLRFAPGAKLAEDEFAACAGHIRHGAAIRNSIQSRRRHDPHQKRDRPGAPATGGD